MRFSLRRLYRGRRSIVRRGNSKLAPGYSRIGPSQLLCAMLLMISRFLRTPALFVIMLARASGNEALDHFETKVRPVLVEHCYQCHGPEKQKGGLRLDTRQGVLEGGDTGPALIPHDPGKSLLVKAIGYHDRDLQMPPPKDGASRKLTAQQIDDFVTWVKLGAPFPEETLAPSTAPHWAFQPLSTPAPPPVQDNGWLKTEVDAFVLAKLNSAGLSPSKPADKRTLIRRATFDLIGLPPTAEEVQAFIDDPAPDAFTKVVDRLLASPRYGERWGRHWLDLARYSDTKGYVYGREERFFVHAHAYRDWVIDALNKDLPYNQFLLLQIAADQLVPNGSPDLAAMGFLTGGRRFTGITHEIIDDRIDVITRSTMALTVQCARCHDHKYDPIPTQDYYSLYGVFQASAERLVCIEPEPTASETFTKYRNGFEERARKLTETMQRRRAEAGERLRSRVGDYLAAQLELAKYPEEGFDQILAADDIIPASVRRWRDFLDRAKKSGDPLFTPWHVLSGIPAEEFEAKAAGALARLARGEDSPVSPLVLSAFADPPKSMREVAERYGKLFARVEQEWKTAHYEAKAAGAPEPSSLDDPHAEALRRFLYDPSSPTTVPELGIVDNELFFPTSACEELWKLQGELDRWIINTPGSLRHALVLFDREPEANPRVFKRGNPARRAEEIPRQFLSVVAGPERAPFQKGSGRLELAQAIVRPDNPLTARVAVNRLWMHHFGEGLVRTPSDFGLRAVPPSHPELLDWLAQRFIAEGWSMKKLHRLIMLSAVYQQAGEPHRADGVQNPRQIDPENRLLWRFTRHRLDFEQTRDALLAVSGELDTKMGGKPLDMFSAGEKRRSIYGLVDRQFVPATFRVFDFASPDTHVGQRHETTIPQQGLFFLNHQFVAQRAKAVLVRPEIEQAALREERIERLYKACFQRSPNTHERSAALHFIAATEAEATAPPPKPTETPWRYGWGEYDREAERVKTFRPLPHFTGNAWQGGSNWPDATLGWAQLTAEGGHAGNDLQHAVIRRWVAPRDATIFISGKASHEYAPGDGIRAFLVSSRHGELRSAELHNSAAEMVVNSLKVKQGDTIDFVVDFRADLNSDMFQWAPVISVDSGSAADTDEMIKSTWNAQKEFEGVPPASASPLTPWEQLAQVLLLSNEFAFVD